MKPRGEEQKLARLRLRISLAAETILRSGHPWLFAESIQEQNREGRLGELAVIYDRKDQFLALGLFDPDSPIRLRVLHAGKPQAVDDNWWSERLDQALHRAARERRVPDEARAEARRLAAPGSVPSLSRGSATTSTAATRGMTRRNWET